MDTVTDVFEPGARVPLPAESVIQLAALLAAQTSVAPPTLLSVKTWLLGLKGPPAGPAELNPETGLTASCPAGLFTVRLTERVVLPAPPVVLVKDTVSEYAP